MYAAVFDPEREPQAFDELPPVTITFPDGAVYRRDRIEDVERGHTPVVEYVLLEGPDRA